MKARTVPCGVQSVSYELSGKSNLNVYCVLAHSEPSNLKSLLKTLQGKKVIVHLDKSVDRSKFLKELGPLPELVEILDFGESFRVEWAGWNMVRAELALFKNALKSLGSGDHAILLSGACYPCRPLSDFEDFLNKNSDKELISFNSLGNVEELKQIPTGPGFWKVKYLYLSDMIVLPPIPWLVKYVYKIRNLINERRLRNPRFDPNYAYYVGSQWIALTQRMSSSVVENENLLRHKFKYSFAPDELAIQSFVVNKLGPDSDSLCGEDFDTYAIISGPFHYLKLGSPPATVEDLPAISKSEKFFVRKPTNQLRKILEKRLKISLN